ncbi:MAG: energy transducer TonB, partial [Bacteroidota bacterium]
MKNVFFSIIFLLLYGICSGQPIDKFASNLDKLYPEGHKAFLNVIYQNVKYPAPARENCRVGKLKTLVSIDTSGAVKSVSLVNRLGMGIDEEVVRVLELTSGNWLKGRSLKYPINFAFRIGDNQKDIEGDIVVTALGIGRRPDGGCSVPIETIEKEIKKYEKKGKFKEVGLLYEELLRRY